MLKPRCSTFTNFTFQLGTCDPSSDRNKFNQFVAHRLIEKIKEVYKIDKMQCWHSGHDKGKNTTDLSLLRDTLL